jgi:hypothetical protein
MAVGVAAVMGGVGLLAMRTPPSSRPVPTTAHVPSGLEPPESYAAPPTAGPAAAPEVRGPRPTAGSRTAGPPSVDEPAIAEVERRAVERGELTPDDVGKAWRSVEAAARSHGPQYVAMRHREFGRRMQMINYQVRIRPLLDDLSTMADQISVEHDAAARQRLVDGYRATADELPAQERDDALARLGSSDRAENPPSNR